VLSQSFGDRLNRILKTHEFFKNDKITLNESEKEAIREAILTNKEIKGRPDLNKVVRVMHYWDI